MVTNLHVNTACVSPVSFGSLKSGILLTLILIVSPSTPTPAAASTSEWRLTFFFSQVLVRHVVVNIAAGNRHHLRVSPNPGAHPPHRQQAALTYPELGIHHLVSVPHSNPTGEKCVQDVTGQLRDAE